MLFKKKSQEPPTPKDTPEVEDVTESASESQPSVAPNLMTMSAEIERIKASMQALNEVRKVTTERFSTISEQIGELRSSIATQERNLQGIEVKSTRASDLVASVQPEKILVEVKRLDAKIEAINSRIESNQIINNNIRDELKDIRNKMALFRGVDQLLQLNEDVKKELRGIQKVKAETERNADKVATIFVEVEKNFSEFKKFKDIVDSTNSMMRDVLKQMDKMKVKFNTFASKENTDSFMKKMDKKFSKVQDFVKLADQSSNQMSAYQQRMEQIEQDHMLLMSVYDKMHTNFERLNGWLNYYNRRLQ